MKSKIKGRPAVWTPRATTYRGISMRSRLEAAWAEQFDAWRLQWQYEPRCFASELGQYLPDFLLPEPWIYVEVKPWSWFGSWETPEGWDLVENKGGRMLRILRASDNDARLWIVTNAGEDGLACVLEVDPAGPEDPAELCGFTDFLDFSKFKPVASLHATGFHGGF